MRRVFECELAPVTKPSAMDAFDTTASGLYAMNLGKDRPATDFVMPLLVPRDGTYALWLRVKSGDNAFALRVAVDNGKTATIQGKPCVWAWLKIAHGVRLFSDRHSVAIAANVPYVLIDQLVVTDEPAPQFDGAEGADMSPAPVPNSLAARATGRYSVRVEWGAEPSINFHHVNLYASSSPECEVKQENLVASPSGKHTVQIIRGAKEDDLECGSVIVTNDFGFLPNDGYTSFLPLPAE